MNFDDLKKMTAHVGRRLSGKQAMAPAQDLSEKKIIITGASPNSIGFESALTFAQWGAQVIVSSRSNTQDTVKALQQALEKSGNNASKNKGGSFDGHDLELSNFDSVNKFAAWYLEKHSDRLDILMNNAGIHLDFMSQWSEPNLIDDVPYQAEIHWRTNYLGSSQLTHLLLPLLKQTGTTYGDARVVNISSQLQDMGINKEFFENTEPYNSWQAYGQSKLGLVHAAFEINRRFSKEFNLKGYSLHPGSVFTNIAHKGLDGNSLIQNIRNLFAPIEAFFLLSPKEGAQTQILCASSPTLEGGKYYERCELGEVNPEANDAEASNRLWQQTETYLQERQSS